MTAGSTMANEKSEEKSGAEKTKATDFPWLHFMRFEQTEP
jgi:hypothetical protein